MTSKSRRPRELLTPAALHVLLSLVDGPRHGYGIQRDVAERTGGKLKLGPGTLYEAIHRMLESGWIAHAGRDTRRKNYRLTGEGRRQLKAELARLESLVSYARSKALLGSER